MNLDLEECNGNCEKIEVRIYYDKNGNFVNVLHIYNDLDIRYFFDIFCKFFPEFENYSCDPDNDMFCFSHKK